MTCSISQILSYDLISNERSGKGRSVLHRQTKACDKMAVLTDIRQVGGYQCRIGDDMHSWNRTRYLADIDIQVRLWISLQDSWNLD